MLRVLFVCLGNICRSPLAAAVFRHLVAEAGLEERIAVDSAGTSAWHVGEPAHEGTRRVLKRRGIPCRHRARQIAEADLENADYIVVMDRANEQAVRELAGSRALDGRLHLLLDFAPQLGRREVPDPWYDGNFEEVYRLVEAGCRGLLGEIRRQRQL